MSSGLRRVLILAAGLVALVVVLALVVYALGLILQPPQTAAPVAQEEPDESLLGTTAANNVSGYLAGQGYRVDLVGNPRNEDGSLDSSTVVALMPVQSPSYRFGESVAAYPEIQRQISLGFIACERFFQGVERVGVGLEWGEYIHLFPASAADLRDVRDGRLSVEDFWARVESEASLIYASTWQPVYSADQINKDFVGNDNWGAAAPLNSEAPSKGLGQVRLQPSTAYLPLGDEMVLVATVLNAQGEAVVGQAVTFTYALQGEDPQTIGTATTGPDGAARAQFSAAGQAQGITGTLLLGASTENVAANAAAPVVIGPEASGEAALAPVMESLRLYGYNVINARFEAAGTTGTRTSVLAEIAAPRFDLRVRAQVLSMAGTLMAIYPALEQAEPVLLYRSAGNSYQLVFRVERDDWEAWLDNSTNESELWERIRLRKIVDAETGQPIDQRQFLAKNFADAVDTLGVSTPKSTQATLTSESWGDQLNVGRIQVPVEAYADTFTVEERTAGTEFTIFAASDPTSPVYSSSQDSSGAGLRALRLTTGQYVLSVEVPNPPAGVRLEYVERMVDAADTRR